MPVFAEVEWVHLPGHPEGSVESGAHHLEGAALDLVSCGGQFLETEGVLVWIFSTRG